MTLLRSLMLGTLLSIAAVLALQPVYFAAMANLDHVISHEAMRSHFRDASLRRPQSRKHCAG